MPTNTLLIVSEAFLRAFLSSGVEKENKSVPFLVPNFGVLFLINEKLSLGFAYRSRIRVNQSGDVTLSDIAPPLRPLFGGSRFVTDVETTLDEIKEAIETEDKALKLEPNNERFKENLKVYEREVKGGEMRSF